MTETQATHKIQVLAEAKIRINNELNGYRRLNFDEYVTADLYNYVFGEGENPHKDLLNKRDEKVKNKRLLESLQNERFRPDEIDGNSRILWSL